MRLPTENRMTTKVVAYASLRLGHVTRPISLRTSDRKGRERPHHPVTLSRARPPNESSGSAAPLFILLNPRRSTYRRFNLAGQEGIEPPTPGFGDRCSAN